MDAFLNPFVLLLVAFVLIFLEFFLPGGIIGVFGIIFVVLSLVAFFLEGHSTTLMTLYFIFVVLALVLLIKFILKAIKKTGPKNTIMLDKNQEGYIASSFDESLMLQVGVAMTDLKPAGKILVSGKEVQALSQLGYIPRGTRVKVIGGQGAHLIVKEDIEVF